MLLNPKHKEKISISTPLPGRPARGTRTGRPILVLFDLLGRRWALRVIWELREGNAGFRALQDRCEQMSSSVLQERLRELVAAGLIETDEAGLYGLTPEGRGLVAALQPLIQWAAEWGKRSR